MRLLSEKIEFPPHETATKEGVLALGGDLSPKRLLFAYRNGIFPWYSLDEPIVWYSPKKRMVLFPKELKISKSMTKIIKKNKFEITENQAFEEVIHQCKNIIRNDNLGTWITDDMEQAYIKLHKKGYAKSIEVWSLDSNSDVLGKSKKNLASIINPNCITNGIGPEDFTRLYGLEIGNIFCGESMFSKVSNTSKIAFIHLVNNHNYQLIDCQVYNNHLASLGAREILRDDFLQKIKCIG
ncbi:leucyl/phenylalanyl-tRNA--protein transferase [Flavobacteriaceae bacterium]|nr:leucyl/phenylalanyl-tRNA--protein transferase [Flavobacteriaceae bacterium]